MAEQGHEGFPVRLGMQRFAAIRTQIRDTIDVAREIVEALRAHEETLGPLWQPRQPKRLRERRSVREDCPMVIAVASFRIEPAALRQSFEQRGFPTAVLADEERDPCAKL